MLLPSLRQAAIVLSEIPDAQQKFRLLSLDNFQAMLQTQRDIHTAKLKRLMKKVGSGIRILTPSTSSPIFCYR